MPLRNETSRTAKLEVRPERAPVGWLVHIVLGWNGFTLPAERLAELEDALTVARVELEGVRAIEPRHAA